MSTLLEDVEDARSDLMEAMIRVRAQVIELSKAREALESAIDRFSIACHMLDMTEAASRMRLMREAEQLLGKTRPASSIPPAQEAREPAPTIDLALDLDDLERS